MAKSAGTRLYLSILQCCVLLAVITSGRPFQDELSPRARRVVNGEELAANSWPWLASLHFLGPQHAYQALQSLPHLCGGVLVAPQWVLTAAHCFLAILGEGLNESSNWQVRLGEHNRVRDESTEQTIPVERIFKHPNLTRVLGELFGGDLALLKLSHPAHITAAVTPIPLDSNTNLPTGTRCKVAGWGQLQSAHNDSSQMGRGSLVPMVVELGLVDQQTCSTAYQGSFVRVDDSVLCFGSQEGKDSCQGDSGTPLVCWPRPHQPVVTGILSLGFHCGLDTHPGVYSSVAHYRADILDTIRRETL